MNPHVVHSVVSMPGLLLHIVPKVASYAMTKALSGPQQRVGPNVATLDRERFMVIRHPLDRLVSAWAFFLHTEGAPPAPLVNDNLAPEAPFTEFLDFALDHMDSDRHLLPQAAYHGPHDFGCARFEHLSPAWEGLRARHDYLKPLAHLHRSTRSPDWREHYTPTMRVKAEHAYADDMDLYEKGMNP